MNSRQGNYYSERESTYSRGSQKQAYQAEYQAQPRQSQLLPNEIRVSMKSRFKFVVDNVMQILREGYPNCKVVGRGMACQLTSEVYSYFKRNFTNFIYECMNAKALNKVGEVVDEFHLLISKRDQISEAATQSGYQKRYPREVGQQNSHKSGQFQANSINNGYRQPRQFQTYTNQQQEKRFNGYGGYGKQGREDAPYSLRQRQRSYSGEKGKTDDLLQANQVGRDQRRYYKDDNEARGQENGYQRTFKGEYQGKSQAQFERSGFSRPMNGGATSKTNSSMTGVNRGNQGQQRRELQKYSDGNGYYVPPNENNKFHNQGERGNQRNGYGDGYRRSNYQNSNHKNNLTFGRTGYNQRNNNSNQGYNTGVSRSDQEGKNFRERGQPEQTTVSPLIE
ncbi:UNKNOWN [Stylonychia lemnae]|uniref:Uncharacterized protein n=1 Tax=Stylonychia lemnae TaxID=5949 RepID=A0A078A9M5_STYLE|nr:UNKNOWN [Stylonychia lemnae]|eukprot:CDW78975.1 UNKNOWN [Stylonychia lemnae]